MMPMSNKRALVLATILILIANVGSLSAAAPTLKVTDPADGSVSLTKQITVTGNAAGSDGSWLHTLPDDFENGTSTEIAMTGNDVSVLRTYDDFNDGSLDAAKWSVTNLNGLSMSESGGQLRASGTSITDIQWQTRAAALSTRIVAQNVSVDLVSVSGSGDVWGATVGLYQDQSNYIIFGIDSDPSFGSNPVYYVSVVSGGSQTTSTYGQVSPGSHNFAMGMAGGSVALYLDGQGVGTKSISLQNPRMWLLATVLDRDDTVDARWDNAKLNYYGGSVALTEVYDDFSDNGISSVKWTATNLNGLAVSETGGKLRAGGTGTSSTPWQTSASVASTRTVVKSASVELVSVTGSGSTWSGVAGLYQDTSNYIIYGAASDPTFVNGPLNYLAVVSGGTQSYWTYGQYSPSTSRTLSFTMTGNLVAVKIDGQPVATQTISLQSPKLWLLATVMSQGMTVDARFDNATIDHALTGDFTSAAFDTLSADPELKKVEWNATSPAGAATAIHLRSSDRSDMTGAAAWAALTNGQTTGLPAVKRYLQFKATLTSSDGINTPEFKDIRLSFHKPVKTVEVSIDNGMTWTVATGTTAWSITLTLPENSTSIMVRARDVAGDVDTASVRVEVDTTQPSGTLAINDGAEFTITPEVNLSLGASDGYGVASMMAGEDPDFTGQNWDAYCSTATFTLSGGDGLKTVYVKFKDRNGWESPVYNGSIVLDTIPPAGSIVVNGGAQYTRNVSVSAALDASDQIGVDGMMVSPDEDFRGADWIPFATDATVVVAPGSGERTVFAKFRDRGGHVSQVYSDGILLDQSPPEVKLTCNGGATYTTSPNVTVGLAATENYLVVSVQLGPGDGNAIGGLPWANFTAMNNLTLPAGDGTKTISARLTDIAGNIGAANSTTIVLDTAAPKTTMGALAASSPKAKFNVSWSAADATSGVLWYDAQYKAGDGTWKDLLVHTNLTSAQFTGEDLETYSFRARAQDRAGNQEDFPATVDNAITVRLPEPVLSILGPLENARLKGRYLVCGTCAPVPEGRTVSKVELRVDNGTWTAADGTLNWSFQLDTKTVKDGLHTLQVRTYDGKHYSTVLERPFNVKNAQAAKPSGFIPAEGALLLLCGIGIAMALLAGRRK